MFLASLVFWLSSEIIHHWQVSLLYSQFLLTFKSYQPKISYSYVCNQNKNCLKLPL